VGHTTAFYDPHHLCVAADGGDREAIPHCLGKGREVSLDAKELLRSTVGDAEAGLDLIEDEDDAMAIT